MGHTVRQGTDAIRHTKLHRTAQLGSTRRGERTNERAKCHYQELVQTKGAAMKRRTLMVRCPEKASANRRAIVKGRPPIDALPQGNPNECKYRVGREALQPSRRELEVPSRVKMTEEWGEGTPPENPHLTAPKSIRRRHHGNESTTHLDPYLCHPIPPWRAVSFSFEANTEDAASSWEM